MTLTRLFTGKTCRLTALKKEDLNAIARWYHHSDFIRMYDGTPARPRTERQWETWYEELHNDQNSYYFAIRPTDDEKIIGTVDLTGILWNNGTAWLAIAIGDPANQGKGYGSEAMQLILQFAFHELNLHRIQLTVFSYNTRAITMYEHMGFVQEGVYREFLARDGERHDMILFGLLRREWEAVQKK